MIYILDNGQDYSNHALYFVESDYDNADEVCALLLAHEKERSYSAEASILAIAERFEWRNGGAQQLHECVTPGDFFGNEEENADASVQVAWDGWEGKRMEQSLDRVLFRAAPRRLLVSLIAQWTEHGPAYKQAPYDAAFAACLDGMRRALAACTHDECLADSNMAADCAAARERA